MVHINFSHSEISIIFLPDLADFDNTVIRITFEPDENVADNVGAAPIPVVNDLINEADEQVFIVELHLISSTNPVGIDLTTRPASIYVGSLMMMVNQTVYNIKYTILSLSLLYY